MYLFYISNLNNAIYMLKVPSLYHNHDVYIVLFIFIIIYLKQKICIKKMM